MPRRRLGVALPVPAPLAAEVDGLRRALGDPARTRVAPHVTLVPPTNVAEADVAGVLVALRAAAAAVPGPVVVTLGPVATFHPVTPVAYLAVSGDVEALDGLRRAVSVGPFDRERPFPFVPHVTVATELPPARLDAAVAAGADYRVAVELDLLQLLEEQRDDDGVRRWVPVADVALGPPTVVDRGSLPVELTVGERLDPEAAARVAEWTTAPGVRPFAVTARRDGRVVGVATGATVDGRTHRALHVVDPAERGTGVGRRLAQAVDALADERDG